jgi:hypothetical protein
MPTSNVDATLMTRSHAGPTLSAMPIGDRQPETMVQARSHPVGFLRRGRIDDGMNAQGPGVLLSPGTPTLQASVPAPAGRWHSMLST